MNAVIQALGLSEREWDALEHRLSVGDALADALDEDYAREDTEDVANLLSRGLLTEAINISLSLSRACLRDAVEGSTYVACTSSEYGRDSRRAAGAMRTLRSLARKVGAYIGAEVECPVV